MWGGETWRLRDIKELCGDRETWGPRERHGDPEMWHCGPRQSGQGPSPRGPDQTETGTEKGQAEMARWQRCARDAGGSVGAGPGAPIPRLLVITCPEEAAGS